jgi:hypothetical protein
MVLVLSRAVNYPGAVVTNPRYPTDRHSDVADPSHVSLYVQEDIELTQALCGWMLETTRVWPQVGTWGHRRSLILRCAFWILIKRWVEDMPTIWCQEIDHESLRRIGFSRRFQQAHGIVLRGDSSLQITSIHPCLQLCNPVLWCSWQSTYGTANPIPAVGSPRATRWWGACVGWQVRIYEVCLRLTHSMILLGVNYFGGLHAS